MENKASKKSKLIAASMAGLMAVGTLAAFSATAKAESEMAPCYGVNACKGNGDCGGKGYSCAGKNSCKGTGFIKLPKDACMKIQGGRLTA